MADTQRYEAEWEGLRLVIEEHSDQWQFVVYDIENCEVLELGESSSAELAQSTALEFGAVHRFGPKHGLRLDVLSKMLVWEPA